MSLTEFDAADGRTVSTTTAEVPAVEDAFAMLELGAIVPSLTNPRQTFDETKLEELAESIKAGGVHQPILVRPLPTNRLDETSRKLGRAQRETHEIVSGERRWRASKVAGKATIPALVRHLSDAEVLEIQIIENLQRDDLTELDEAEGYQRLVDQTAIAKEAIGEKIGKSRGYVYARLKLLDLNTAGREALRRGEIDASKALLVARVPNDKLQIKALGQATGSDNYGRPLSYKELQAWLQTNVMLSLKRTRFDIKDMSLREGAGACTDCPKRTGANPDLFHDVESADLCTDPDCYHDKEKTADERRFEAAKVDGAKTLDTSKVEKLHEKHRTQWLKGYQLLDERPDYSLNVDGGTLRRVLGKHCPEPVLVMNPETGLLAEVLPIDTVKKLIKQHGLSRDAKRAERQANNEAREKAEAAKLPVEQRPEFEARWQASAIQRADEYLLREPAVGTPDLIRAWLIQEASDWEAGSALEAVTNSSGGGVVKTIANTPDEDVPRLLLRFMLRYAASLYDAFSDEQAKQQGPRTPLFEILNMASIDVAEVKAETKRAMESEDRVAEAEAEAQKASAQAPKPVKAQKPKKSSAPPAAQALRGGKTKKTTAAEAQTSIAAALQAAEEEQDQAPNGAGLDEGAALAAPAAHAPDVSWPFPIDIGLRVRITKGDHVDVEGKVSGQVVGTDRWQVNIARPKKAAKIIEVSADALEVLT